MLICENAKFLHKTDTIELNQYNRVIRKVTLSFTPYPLFELCPQSNENFIQSQHEMLKKLSIYCTKFESR